MTAVYDNTITIEADAALIFLGNGIDLEECVLLPEQLAGIELEMEPERYKSLELVVESDVQELWKNSWDNRRFVEGASLPGLYVNAQALYNLIMHEEAPIGCSLEIEFSHGFPFSYFKNEDFEQFALSGDCSAFQKAYERLISEGRLAVNKIPEKPYEGRIVKQWLLRSFLEQYPPHEKKLVRVPATFFTPRKIEPLYQN